MMRFLQRLGKSLMQPVAVLPIAAILMGIGYAIDPVDWGGASAIAQFFISAGAAILDNLGVLFAVGVAYGMSKDNNGAAALSGLVGFLMVITLLSPGAVANYQGGVELAPELGWGAMNFKNVFVGILSGLIAAGAYNKFYQVRLPAALAFFSGRRLVPIMTGLFSILFAVVLYFIWPIVYSGLVTFGMGIAALGPIGAGIYGFFNRLLIPTGLHHALNNVFWFDTFGINDIGNFWSNTTSTLPGVTTGMYQAGFFPIMMFGLPGAALAMYHTAKDKQKKTAASLLLAGAVAAFVTGVTEPLEFAFMFLAPFLYLIHAGLTAVSLIIAASLKWIAGFGFSAGLIDLLLSSRIPLATNWFLLIPLGLVFFVLYYVIFRFFITKFNLKTPGREDDDEAYEAEKNIKLASDTDFGAMANTILAGLGGKENIETLDYCATRLRVEVKDHLKVDEKQIKSAKVPGIIRPSQKNVQVIVGPQVQFVHDEINKQI